MKISQPRARSLAAALMLLLVTSFTVQAQEVASTEFLSKLHQFRISNYMSLDAYYRFSASGGTETLNEIVANINEANDAMNSVSDSKTGILSAEQLEILNQEFDQFKSLMRSNINDVRNTGYPDLRLVSDMANQAVTLGQAANELYVVAQDSGQIEVDSRVEAARFAAVTMAQMMAKYSARTHSQVAQTFQGSSSDVALDEQARQFDALLSSIQNGNTSGELKSAIDGLSTKWQFIRGSYINFNENNVAFVIDRYSKSILDGLATTIGLLTNSA